jgi:acetyl-CoA synthetase
MASEETSFGSITVDWENEPVPDLSQFGSCGAARENFSWEIPDTFNIATDVDSDRSEGRFLASHALSFTCR